FFAQWITRTGAPALSVDSPKAVKTQQGYRVQAMVNQVQSPAYTLKVPVAVALEGHDELWRTTVDIDQKHQSLTLQIPAKPTRLFIDPEFDLFRKLDRREIPPAMSQAFGAEQALFVLPASAPEPLLTAWRQIAQRWLNAKHFSGTIQSDTELTQLPKDRAVWIFGWQNRFSKEFRESIRQYPIKLNESEVALEGREFTRLNHTVVITARQQIDHAFVWIGTDNPSALPGLSQKLPHYSRYSYLVFEGNEPAIVLKGQWPVVDSPLSVRIK
ncbi:MAG TPA: peptidase M28, partial [Thermodesulfovibrionia bacterium]|nr:peptidase M28 [Thermodesulfovibrionia bacterium]